MLQSWLRLINCMNSVFLKLENKIAAILECNIQLKNRGIPLEDTTYTVKIKRQYIKELILLIKENPELSEHQALMKIKTDLDSYSDIPTKKI